MATLMLTIAALALLNAGRLALARTIVKASQRIVRKVAKVRCTFAA